MADHRFGHRLNRGLEQGSRSLWGNVDAMVLGCEIVSAITSEYWNFVAFPTTHGLEADRERRQAGLALLGQQRHDQRESSPPESRTPTGTSATILRRTAGGERCRQRVLPVGLGPVAAVGVAGEARDPSNGARAGCRPVRRRARWREAALQHAGQDGAGRGTTA